MVARPHMTRWLSPAPTVMYSSVRPLSSNLRIDDGCGENVGFEVVGFEDGECVGWSVGRGVGKSDTIGTSPSAYVGLDDTAEGRGVGASEGRGVGNGVVGSGFVGA